MKFTNEEVKNFINENEMCIIYFNGMKCGACCVIRNKVLDILKNYKEVKFIDIDIEENTKLASEFSVFSAPFGIIYIGGKEYIKFGRNVDLLDLEKNIDRYYDMVFK